MNLIVRSVFVWFGFLAVAFLNGALREIFLIKFLQIKQHRASQLSCLSGALMFFLVLQICWHKLALHSVSQSVCVGVGWMVATVIFETFILNRKLSWPEIFQTYNVFAGELWGLVVVWIGVLPVLMLLFVGQGLKVKILSAGRPELSPHSLLWGSSARPRPAVNVGESVVMIPTSQVAATVVYRNAIV